MSNPPSNKLTNPPSTSDILNAVQGAPENPAAEQRDIRYIATEVDYLDKTVEHEIKKAKLKTLQDNNVQRKRYAINTFILTCFWIGIVIVIVIQTGRKALVLSDSVLITLITTTTASVFGFFLLVMKYLFNPEFEKPKISDNHD